MQTLETKTTNRFVVFTESTDLQERFNLNSITILNTKNIATFIEPIAVIAVDCRDSFVLSEALVKIVQSAEKFVLVHSLDQVVPLDLISKKMPELLLTANNLSFETFLTLDEQIQQSQQDMVYLNLAEELNSEYENLKSVLEKKLSEHKTKLIESRQKILDSNNRNEALRKILYALHQESDVARIETLLNELIPATSTATWIKIILASSKNIFEADLKNQLDLFYISYDLNLYSIYFIKGDQKKFKKDDLELFQKIRDALSLNLTRHQNLSDLVLAEKILTEAFETFPQPLAVIDNDYNVLNSNKTFYKNNRTKCYEILFNAEKPCLGCKLGTQFQIDQNNKYFEVTSNAFATSSALSSKNIWVHTYKDRTEEIYLEQRLTQNAKMKDLGLVSSSIAHELNNPLGGIISYLQILQMEMSKESEIQADLQAMIQTSYKMKKIIEDLLVFSRRPEQQSTGFEVISDVLLESLSESDLIFKAENIKVSNTFENLNQKIKISKKAFKDSIYFIFQFFIERARYIKNTKQNFTGLVEIKFSEDPVKSTLRFVGNFGPLENDYKLKNVQFLAIHKTLIDQGFHVQLTEPDKTWVAIDVIFPKTEFKS